MGSRFTYQQRKVNGLIYIGVSDNSNFFDEEIRFFEKLNLLELAGVTTKTLASDFRKFRGNLLLIK